MTIPEVIEKCHRKLLTSKVALAYLASRNVTIGDLKKFKIGYIGNFLDNVDEKNSDDARFNKWLGRKGYFVRHRILFPIYDELGNLVGCETRGLDQKALTILRPKYKEAFASLIAKIPQDSLRYKKFYYEASKQRACFFGLPSTLNSIYNEKSVFLTEGIFDCMSALKIYPNCLSTLTANINKFQLNWLQRYVEKIIFLYDSDKKGKSAVKKILRDYNDIFSIYFIGLGKDDVNSLDIRYGSAELQKRIDSKLDYFF